MIKQDLSLRIEKHLLKIYEDIKSTEDIKNLANDLTIYIENTLSKKSVPLKNINKWSENDVVLISYANSLTDKKQKPLITLNHFLEKNCKDLASIVHILPFFPSSSDHGFSVIDYYSVDKAFGDWSDIKSISKNFSIMCDVVINHGSAKSEWFSNFVKGNGPGSNYFLTADNSMDLSNVTRPRTSNLLSKVNTSSGEQYVWCTFSEDQVDYNFENYEVLKEFVSIISFYLNKGVSIFRFDAVAFLWKKVGTNCINLPQTHEIVRLFRTIIDYLSSDAILVTETNTPARENVSYFGNANEAHWIYNFSLPPILIYSILKGNASYLEKLTMSLPPAQLGSSYLNFIASHDGIGLRPAEGILSKTEINNFISQMKKNGGLISYRADKDGKSNPYEINISLFDAMTETFGGETNSIIDRYLCIHTIMMSLEGVPGLYIHSLFGTQNDYKLYDLNKHNRDLNRHIYTMDEIDNLLNDQNKNKIFYELKRLLSIRKKQKAFHPNAVQFTLHLGNNFYGIWRQSQDKTQSIFCITNMTDKVQDFSLMDINLIGFDKWKDLINNENINNINSSITLSPYQSIWLSNQ